MTATAQAAFRLAIGQLIARLFTLTPVFQSFLNGAVLANPT